MDIIVNLAGCFKDDWHSKFVSDIWERTVALENTYKEEGRDLPMERYVPLIVDLHLSAEIYFRAFQNDDVWCPDDGRYNRYSDDVEHSNITHEMAKESGVLTVLDRLERHLSYYYYLLCDLEWE